MAKTQSQRQANKQRQHEEAGVRGVFVFVFLNMKKGWRWLENVIEMGEESENEGVFVKWDEHCTWGKERVEIETYDHTNNDGCMTNRRYFSLWELLTIVLHPTVVVFLKFLFLMMIPTPIVIFSFQLQWRFLVHQLQRWLHDEKSSYLFNFSLERKDNYRWAYQFQKSYSHNQENYDNFVKKHKATKLASKY